MTSIAPPELQFLSLQRQSSAVASTTLPAVFHHSLPPCLLSSRSTSAARCFQRFSRSRSSIAVTSRATLTANSVPQRNGAYTVGDYMTRKEDLYAVKPTTTVDEALEMLVENRITGFPVIDDDWKLEDSHRTYKFVDYWNSSCNQHKLELGKVGLVSDYDLLALDSVSGGKTDASLFPEVDSTWKTFNHIQTLLSKTNGQVVGDLMTPAPLVVRESTNLEDAARILLETKYRRLPVVDAEGKLVGIITRGNVVRAALQVKRELEKHAKSANPDH